MGKYKSLDGFTITNGGGFMGIHSACNLLNEKIAENKKLREALEQIKSEPLHPKLSQKIAEQTLKELDKGVRDE